MSLLSKREFEVIHLLWDGYANEDIARELGITVGGVKGHVKRMCDKLGCDSRLALAMKTFRQEHTITPKAPEVRS